MLWSHSVEDNLQQSWRMERAKIKGGGETRNGQRKKARVISYRSIKKDDDLRLRHSYYCPPLEIITILHFESSVCVLNACLTKSSHSMADIVIVMNLFLFHPPHSCLDLNYNTVMMTTKVNAIKLVGMSLCVCV